MAQAIITVTDVDGEINVHMAFNPNGIDEESAAHSAALDMLQVFGEKLTHAEVS